MSRAFVVKVETSIKRGAVAQPGPKTLIVGKNRAGKSTIVNGVEAAGSGRVSDVAGRASLAKDADLMTLAPRNTDRVFAHVRLSDGATCEWSLERGHRAKRTGPEVAFPLRDVREAILGEPDKARKWILRNGGDLAWNEVVALVPESLRGKLAALVGTVVNPGVAGSDIDGATTLTQAIDDARRRVREANSGVKFAREQAKNGTSGLPPPPTKAEIKAAEDVVIAIAQRAQFDSTRAALAQVERDLSVARADVARIEADHAAHEAAFATLPAVPAVTDLFESAVKVAEALVAAKSPTCAICGATVDQNALATRSKNARARITDAVRIRAEKDALAAKIQAAVAGLPAFRRTVSRLEGEVARLAKLAGPNAADLPDPEAARTRLDALRKADAAWTAARSNEEAALQGEQDATTWGQLAEALSKALGTLVERAKAVFEIRVQAYLPAGPDWRFGVDLLDGDREVLRVGLRRDGKVEAALSGAEWATVTAALALATAPDHGPVVIAPEERAFDPETLTEVLEAFGRVASSAQVILTSPVVPSRVPPGWTVITVGFVEQNGKPVTQSHTPERIAEVAAAISAPPPTKRGRKSKAEQTAGFQASIAAAGAEARGAPPTEEESAGTPSKPPPIVRSVFLPKGPEGKFVECDPETEEPLPPPAPPKDLGDQSYNIFED